MGITKKKMKFFQKYWAIFFILFVWFIFASPYFLQGKVPYSSTYQVNHFFPWSAYPQFHGPVKNGAMPDITDQIYPWRHFTIETWKKGYIPFWNPNSFSGNPHLANYQSAVLSPLNLIFFIFSFVDSWSLLVLLAPLAAGIFTYFLLREFNISRIGSTIASLSFMFCGFMVVWMAYGTLSWSIAFLPLSIFSIERWFKKRDKIALLLLSISIPFSIFSGHFQTSLYFLLFTVIFLFFKLLQNHKNRLPILFSFLIGVIISLLQIIPSIQFYFESVRSGIFQTGPGIPVFYLVNLFAPDFFGNPVTRNDWFGYYAEWASFVGIIPLILAGFAFDKKNKLTLFLFILSFIFLLLATDSPIQRLIAGLKIPVISTSNPTRIIVLLSFTLSFLSGFGFDRLLKFVGNTNSRKIYIRVIPWFIIFLFLWVSILFFNFMSHDKNLVAQRNLILPTVIFTLFTLLLVISIKTKTRIILFLIIFLVSFDSLRFAQKWMPFDPKNLVFKDIPIISAIKQNIGGGRIFGNFGANIDTYYNFPGIEGYDPLYIGRYGEFIRSANAGQYEEGERSVVRISRRGNFINRALDLLGVSLIFHPTSDTNQGWAYPVWEDKSRFAKVYGDGNLELYKNNTALPRVKLFYKYEVIKDKKAIIERFYSKEFNFRDILILEEVPNINSNFGELGSTQIVSYTPNRVRIKVQTSSSALLFLSDNFYPSWKAKINGKETKIYRSDYTFRAVVVPQGESTTEFFFVPGF